jgi:hypothetical protein
VVRDALSDGLCLFIQDEKLGTPDARLIPYWRRDQQDFALTEDYYGRRSGAVWEHQDVVHGLFYTEAVSSAQFAAAAVHLPRAARVWERFADDFLIDARFMRAWEALGVSAVPDRSDAATRLGPPVHALTYAELFTQDREAELFYRLTKSCGLYGIVPALTEDVVTSSIPALQPELREMGRRLLVHVAARGAMRAAATPAHRREVKRRARRLLTWAAEFLDSHPAASVAAFQAGVGEFLTAEAFGTEEARCPALDCTSHFMQLDPEELYRLSDPEDTLYYFLDLSLRYPAEFTEAYNEALNRMGFGLQRIQWEPETGRYLPPFYVEYAPDEESGRTYRYAMELQEAPEATLTLHNAQAGTLVLRSERPIRSAHDLFRTLFSQLRSERGIAVVGKAAPFAAELKRWPRAMGLPRQGSRYAPLIDHFLAGLRQRGVVSRDCSLVIRIGLDALDRLAAAGGLRLRLPRFLAGALGPTVSCLTLAREWRRVVAAAQGELRLLQRCEFGQHAHLARLLIANATGVRLADAAAADETLARFLRPVAGPHAGDWSEWATLGADLPTETCQALRELVMERDAILVERRRREPQAYRPLRDKLERIDGQILLLYAAYVRRLWQRAESLPYLNDRPYTLSLWLLFGPQMLRTLVEQATFDFEYVVERASERTPCGCGPC